MRLNQLYSRPISLEDIEVGLDFTSNTKLLIPGLTESERLSSTPLEREIFYNKTNKKIYFGDGLTLGGLQINDLIELESILVNANITLNNTYNNKWILASGNIIITVPISFGKFFSVIHNTGLNPITISGVHNNDPLLLNQWEFCIIYSDGTNWYAIGDLNFKEKVQDITNELLVAGDNISLLYNDANNTLTISIPNENIDDRVANLLTAGNGISLDYNDASNSLTITNTGGGGGGSSTDITDIWLYGE